MGWFWADTTQAPASSSPASNSASSTAARDSGAVCPIDHSQFTRHRRAGPNASAPAGPSTSSAPSAQPESTGRCPIDHTDEDALNPLNMMPALAQHQISAQQGVPLPVEREISSIPKAPNSEGAAKWEYPSAQQLYNAMVRKGFEQSGEHVESMLSVHNFLNEGAWNEILAWERLRDPDSEPFLRRFTGRPATPSPKAWMVVNVMGGTAPFDRHDWYVARQDGSEARYVIDYYEGPDEENVAGVYFLDIRPALDSPGAAYQRISRWTAETWEKARGQGGRA